MYKLILVLFLTSFGVSASAANWQGVYDLIGSALAAPQETDVDSSRELDPNSIQYNARAATAATQVSEQPVASQDADSMLRQYLFNASNQTLLALIDEKSLDNDLVERFRGAVDSGDRRLIRLVRNQVVDMLARLYPYEAAQ